MKEIKLPRDVLQWIYNLTDSDDGFETRSCGGHTPECVRVTCDDFALIPDDEPQEDATPTLRGLEARVEYLERLLVDYPNPVHEAAAELVEEVEAFNATKRTMTVWEWREFPKVRFRYEGDENEFYTWVPVGVNGYLQLTLASSVTGKEIRANTGFLESQATEV
jgi:hypothetical protein